MVKQRVRGKGDGRDGRRGRRERERKKITGSIILGIAIDFTRFESRQSIYLPVPRTNLYRSDEGVPVVRRVSLTVDLSRSFSQAFHCFPLPSSLPHQYCSIRHQNDLSRVLDRPTEANIIITPAALLHRAFPISLNAMKAQSVSHTPDDPPSFHITPCPSSSSLKPASTLIRVFFRLWFLAFSTQSYSCFISFHRVSRSHEFSGR